MLTDTEIAFLNARLDEDEALILRNSDGHGLCDSFPDYRTYKDGDTKAADEYIEHFGPARMLREVSVWRRLLLEYHSAPLDAVYGGTERETGFRLALSAALKAKIATYDGNPVTGEPFPVAP